MSVDAADLSGVYFSTSTGRLFQTRDDGRACQLLAHFLPPKYSIEAFAPSH
jgi:hypothetical protein